MRGKRSQSSSCRRGRSLFLGTIGGVLAGLSCGPLALGDAAFQLSPAGLAQTQALRAANQSNLAGPLANSAAQAQIALSVGNLARAAQALKAMNVAQTAASAASQLTLNNAPLSGSSWNGTPLSGLNPGSAPWINANPATVSGSTETIQQTASNAILTWQSFDLNKGETLIFNQQSADWTVLNRITAGPPDPISGSRFVASPSYILGSIQAPGSVYVINPNGIIFGPTAQINVHSLIASSLDVGLPTMTLAQRNAVFLNNGITPATIPAANFSYNANDTTLQGDVTVDAGATITTSELPRSISPDAGGFVYLFAPNVTNNGSIITPAGETMMVAAQAVQLTPNEYPDGNIGPPAVATFRGTGINTTQGGNSPVWLTGGSGAGEITAPGTVTNNGLIYGERGIIILNGDDVTQNGIIEADTSVSRNGEIFLNARLQLNLGSNSITQILPDGFSLALSANGTPEIVPDPNGETIPLSAIQNFTPGSIEMSGDLVDFQGTTPTSPGALVLAPGGSVNVATALTYGSINYPTYTTQSMPTSVSQSVTNEFGTELPRIYLDSGATIDVSGLDGVTLPMSANLATFKPFGNEFADQPLQRNGALRGQSLTVDLRQSGTIDGVPWVGTPLADLAGLAADIPLSVDQLLTKGGTVTLTGPGVSKAQFSGSDIILRQGSIINVAGGYVQYQGGVVATTELLTADGHIVNIANANPLVTYVGIAGVTTETHPHWGSTTTETFVNPLFARGQFQTGYVQGSDAGGIDVAGSNYVLDGSFSAGAIAGELQLASGKLPSLTNVFGTQIINSADPRIALQTGYDSAGNVTFDPSVLPSAGYLNFGAGSVTNVTNLLIQSPQDYKPLPADFALGTTLASADAAENTDRTVNTYLSAGSLSAGNFGAIQANFSGSLQVEQGADLTVSPGGSILLTAGSDATIVKNSDGSIAGVTGQGIDIEGQLTARAGTITISESRTLEGEGSTYNPAFASQPGLFDLTIGPNAVLDTSGEWVNDTGANQEDLQGGGYVNGGSVTLKTAANSLQLPSLIPGTTFHQYADLTGNIILASGSLLNASSGGRIGINGQQQLSNGVPIGKGGNVTLQTYAGGFASTNTNTAPTTALGSNIVFQASDGTPAGTTAAIDATIQVGGFAQDGGLTIQAPTIQLGGSVPGPGNSGTFYLPDSFFAGGSFGNYSFASVFGGTTVAPGSALVLSQKNFIASPDLASQSSGVDIAGIASLGALPEALRAPTNLSLAATLYPIPLPFPPQSTVPGSAVALAIGSPDQTATIESDPGAKISVSVIGRPSNTDTANEPLGPILEQTGVAAIWGTITAPSGQITLSGDPTTGGFWFGPNSALNAPGIAIPDTLGPQGQLLLAGSVLPGGTISVSANSVVAVSGASIDVSGTVGTLNIVQSVAQNGLTGLGPVPITVWSDAGSITLAASTLLYDGGFQAQPGAPQANGGTLTIETGTNGTVVVQQNGNVAQTTDQNGNLVALGPTDPIPAAASGSAYFQADRLDGSGIVNLTLSADTGSGDTIGFTPSPGTIDFNGNVTLGGPSLALTTLDSLALDASAISITHPQKFSKDPTPCGANVCLSANYFALRGANGVTPSDGSGIFTAQANMIDIATGGTAFQHVDTVNLISTGDIRLRTPLGLVSDALNSTLTVGELVMTGDMNLTAAQIYPASDVDFTLKSVDPKGNITIVGNGTASAPPLSAGGQLTLDATHINQGGTLLAPLGKIQLGALTANDLSPNDPTSKFAVTQSVTLDPGSITSVSLDLAPGTLSAAAPNNVLTVPFGETADGKNWSYDSATGIPLTSPPEKEIAISGQAVVTSGATIDLNGGGDIQALEFVPGTGGTRDVLVNNSISNPNVFAIIPGYNPAAAPVDYDFLDVPHTGAIPKVGSAAVQNADVLPSAGSSVYLSGGPEFAPGYYTLLPAHYATLPGAYRVEVTTTQNVQASNNTVLPDGTLQMAGTLARLTGIQNGVPVYTQAARTTLVNVQSSKVWRQYSEIDSTSGNTYFATLNPAGTAPRLPIDAGHLVFDVVSGLDLSGQILSTPASGGLGGELDIAAQDIQILPSSGTANAGYVGIDPTQLSDTGMDSVLIGGVRSDGANGETIAQVADSVEISNDANSPLTAPQIIVVTTAAGQGLQLDPGSVIQASGKLAKGDPTNVTIGSAKNKNATPPIPSVDGAGALLAVSTGAPLTVTRQNVSGPNGVITIAAGATIQGPSVTFNTTGAIQVSDSAKLSAANISIGSNEIDFGAAPANADSFAVSAGILAQLEQAQTLILQSATTINFNGAVDLAMANPASQLVLDAGALAAPSGGGVTINAGTVELIDSSATAPASTQGTGTLTVDGTEIVLGAGDKTLSGFGAVDFAANQEIALRDTGSLDAGAAQLTFDAPLILVGAGSVQNVTTTGAALLQTSSGAETLAPLANAEIGGTFTLNAASISDSTLIQAIAGGVTLEASNGDVTLSPKAQITATGFAQTFFDTTRVASGGTVKLIADNGNVEADTGAVIDISSPIGFEGNAGQITLSAPNGTLSSGSAVAFDPTTIAGTLASDSGGSLTIDAQSLGTTSIAVPAIFSNTVDIRVRQGGLQLADNLTAQNVTLTADTGTLTVGTAIDASGAQGGTISLYGQGVVLQSGGQLLATASDATQNGGDIVIGTQGTAISDYIDLQSGSVINVSGGADAAGGLVHLRAPMIGNSAITAKNGKPESFTSNNVDVAIDTVGATITGASNVTVEAYQVFSTQNSAFNGTINPVSDKKFYGYYDTTNNVWTGDLVNFVQNFSLSSSATAKFSSIASNVLHLQPGIELDNNNGNITVSKNWNLGAGTAGFLVNATAFTANGKQILAGTTVTDQYGNLLPQYASYTGALDFVSGISQITSMAYRVGGVASGEAGALTLRASGDLLIKASITDGFFQTQNRLDPTYLTSLDTWIAAAQSVPGNFGAYANNVGGYVIAAPGSLLAPPPLAPYTAAGNVISPVSSAADLAPIAGADLFPLQANGQAIGSWSYNLVGGADTTSADPLAVQPLAVFADGGSGALAGHGNVIISGHTEITSTDVDSTTPMEIPTIVRTGTGSINIAAGRDFELTDKNAPGVVYTAGRNSPALPSPYTVQSGQTTPTLTNPAGFFAPQVLQCNTNLACNPYGPITAAAYPIDGGNVTIAAQQDILGLEDPTLPGKVPNQQYFAPWLLAQGSSSQSQTSWWINFGSFDQGVMSVGGNVTVDAGRDISQVSVSLPTTLRVSGGLTSTTTDAQGNTITTLSDPILNPTGNLTVSAGRDLLSGAYYEGSGIGKITAGGSVAANWAAACGCAPPDPNDPTNTLPNNVSTILAVDTGTITLDARGSIDIAGVVSGASLQNVAPGTYLSSYGPNSAVTLLSVSGTIVTNSLADSAVLVSSLNGIPPAGFPGINDYPANFEAATLLGDVQIANSFTLAPSSNGQLDLLAYGSISTYVDSTSGSATSSGAISTGPSLVENVFNPLQPLAGFGPAPGSGSLIADLGQELLPQENASPDLFYAVTGDVNSCSGAFCSLAPSSTSYNLQAPLSWEIDRPAQIHAGGDIVDLSYFGQNLAATDVTQIVAGGSIFYTGRWQFNGAISGIDPVTRNTFLYPNAGGLSLAGPGFFDIEAGGNIGPFLTAAADAQWVVDDKNIGKPINNATGIGIITFGNTVTVGNRLTLTDPFAFGPDNLLPQQGADIVILFGDSKGVNYQGVINAYLNPSPPAGTVIAPRNYLPQLVTFLQTLGLPPQSQSDAWTTFNTLSPTIQHIFADQIAFNEMNLASGNTQPAQYPNIFIDHTPYIANNLIQPVQYPTGYNIIETLFPASLGYTNDNTVNNAAALGVATGSLDLLHATIKTLQSATVPISNPDGTPAMVQAIDPATGKPEFEPDGTTPIMVQETVETGGDIMLLGPGGNIDVGTLAAESGINPFVQPSGIGILTLDNGAIDTFTDASVLVDQSRILTVQGGDVVMWSSNGDLDAGRGARTTAQFTPLSVNFNPQDLQTINLNGLVSGAGIGAIRSTPDAPSGSATLIAPHGTVNAGDASIRSTGNITIAALHVLNAANIAAVGTVSGVPQVGSVNLGSLESAGSTAGQAAKAAEDSVAAATNRGVQAGPQRTPSLITVEVLGFGDCDPEAGKQCQQ